MAKAMLPGRFRADSAAAPGFEGENGSVHLASGSLRAKVLSFFLCSFPAFVTYIDTHLL
jgi:hypothetical protein